MQTIKWQENDFAFEEDYGSPQPIDLQERDMTVEETNESIQLKKYQDPTKDEQRQTQLALINKFGVLFASGNFQGIAQDLLTEDFEIFIFNSTGRASVRNAHRPEGFLEIFKDVKIYERRVRETDIDSEKATACQICMYKISYEGASIPIDEIACEIFSIKEGRISKYRTSFGNPVLDDQTQDPLEPIKKDKMLAKVKEINYALAGQPDFEKVKILLGENVEFKIWRWDDFKCFTLHKSDFIAAFKELQENMSIRCIVPYEISAEGQGTLVTATYVYHLEDNSSGQRYDWLSTCIYGFDNDANIIKVSQQGELHPEGEVDVPFEAHTRETLEKTIHDFSSPNVWNFKLNFLDSSTFLYDWMVWTICFACPPGKRCFQGFKQVQTLIDKQDMFKDAKAELIKVVDIFVDHHNKSHDVMFGLAAAQGKGFGFCEGDESRTVIILFRGAFENGKFAKSLFFLSKVGEPTGTPFDDKSFRCLNIK